MRPSTPHSLSAITLLLLLAQASVLAQADLSTLQGRVVSSGGEPVAEAILSMRPADLSIAQYLRFSGETDDRGAFTIESIPAGKWRVMIRHEEFIDQNPVLDLEAGETRRLDVELQTGGVIVGSVLDREGEPVPGLRLSAAEPGLPPQTGPWFNAETDDEGRFRFSALTRGRYEIDLQDGAHVLIGGSEGRISADVGSSEELLIRVASVGTVRGRVPACKTGYHAYLLAKTAWGESVVSYRRFSSGEEFDLPLTGLRGEVSAVAIRARGHVLHRQEISVANAVSSLDVGEVELEAGGTLEVAVVAEVGGVETPIPGARVTLDREIAVGETANSRWPYRMGREETDAQGRVALHSLETSGARYVLTVEHGRFVAATLEMESGTNFARVSLSSGTKLSGVVLDGEGHPVVGTSVGMGATAENTHRWTRTDEQGRFSLTGLAPGRVTLQAVLEDGSAAARDTRGPHREHHRAVQVGGAEIVLGGPQRCHVAGRLLGWPEAAATPEPRSSDPAPDLSWPVFSEPQPWVTIRSGSGASSSWRIDAPVQPDGSFDLGSMEPGRYTLTPPGGAWQLLEVPDEDALDLELTLPSGSLSGRIVVEDERPVSSPVIKLLSEGQLIRHNLMSAHGADQGFLLSSADARFSFCMLPAGPLVLEVWVPDVGRRLVNVAIVPGENIELGAIEVSSGGTIDVLPRMGASEATSAWIICTRPGGSPIVSRPGIMTSKVMGLDPGTYRVYGLFGGGRPGVSAHGVTWVDDVEVREGESAEVELQLPEARAALEVEIREGGNPASGHQVCLLDDTGRALPQMDFGGATHRHLSNAGTHRFDPLPLGNYRLQVLHLGQVIVEREVTIAHESGGVEVLVELQ